MNVMTLRFVGVALAWFFGLVAVALLLNTYLTKPEPIDQSPTAEQRQAIANQGLHCRDGKLWNDSYSGGFQRSEAVVLDGQFVDCAMKYTVNNQEFTLEEIFVKLFYEKQGS